MKNARASGINVHPEQGSKTDTKPQKKQAEQERSERPEKPSFAGKSDRRSAEKPRKKPRSVSALRNWVADISDGMDTREFRPAKGKKRKK